MRRPSGQVTFLFTDVEGSTRLWAEHTAAMDRAVARHDEMLRAVIAAHEGYVFSTAGDSFAAAFQSPVHATRAAVEAQLALAGEAWDGLPAPLRVRAGLHRGVAHERDGDYFGPEVNLTARVMAAAWGGQILCSDAVAEHLLGEDVDIAVVSLGDHRLRDVPGAVMLVQIGDPGSVSDFPPPRTLDERASTLPAQRSSFVGRQDDIDVLRRMLLDHRLVTLTGPGGTGKTRLAIEVAAREAPRWDGGTFFADLGTVDRGEHVAATVARACLVPPDAGRSPEAQLVEAFARTQALVVVDNCEHVLDAAAEVIDRLLLECPSVTLLATSRAPLDLPGELVYVVDPLDPRGVDARSLFAERASEAGALSVGMDDDAVGALCVRVDGIPLALELAAARTRTLAPVQVLERLDERLDVLGGRRRGTPDRHQTLRATIDWSYELLDDEERTFFDRLAVFAGSFDVAGAACVVGGDEHAAADLLDRLVTQSMVVPVDGADGVRRFRLLETLRSYADEQLSAHAEHRQLAEAAHARYFAQLLFDMPVPRGMALDLRSELEPDFDNLRAALDRPGVELEAELCARATGTFVYLLVNMGLIAEARYRCDDALACDDLEELTRGLLWTGRAYMDATEDGASDFATKAEEALRHLTPGDGVWGGAVGMRSIPVQMFSPHSVLPSLEEGRAQLEAMAGVDAHHDRAMLDFYLAGTLMNLRRFEEATEVFARSARGMLELEPASLIRLWSASGQAIGLTLLGRATDALDVLDEVAYLTDWTDWTVEWAFARSFALAHCGPIEVAREPLYAIGRRLVTDHPSPLTPTVVSGFGVLAALEGRADRAAELAALISSTRSPASTAAVYETVGREHGWSDDDFANEKIKWAIQAVARQDDMARSEFFARLAALVREELAAAG